MDISCLLSVAVGVRVMALSGQTLLRLSDTWDDRGFGSRLTELEEAGHRRAAARPDAGVRPWVGSSTNCSRFGRWFDHESMHSAARSWDSVREFEALGLVAALLFLFLVALIRGFTSYPAVTDTNRVPACGAS